MVKKKYCHNIFNDYAPGYVLQRNNCSVMKTLFRFSEICGRKDWFISLHKPLHPVVTIFLLSV